MMVGLGEAYLPAFALAAGLGDIRSGMVATIPMLFGAVLQLAGPRLVARCGSHRRWVVGCAICQGLSLLLLPLALFGKSTALWVIYGAATIYWATGLATGPAWNTWIETLVPPRLRARYFGLRSRLSHAAVLLGFLAGGFALQGGKAIGWALPAFVALFCLAAAFRFASARFLKLHREPRAGKLIDRRLTWREVAARLNGAQSGRLLAYLLAMQVAVQMAGPYFVPYMLSELRLSYIQFATLVALAFAGKFAALPLVSRLAQRVGPHRLLIYCGLGVAPLSSLWLVSDNFFFLVGLQFFAGAIWAGYELAMLLMFFEAIPSEERTSLLTVYNLGNSAAMAVGTLLGAGVLMLLGSHREGFVVVFWLSSALRLLPLLLLRRIRDTGPEPVMATTGTVAIRPSSGSIESPIMATLDSVPPTNSDCTPTSKASQ
jgi:MFS family permease